MLSRQNLLKNAKSLAEHIIWRRCLEGLIFEGPCFKFDSVRIKWAPAATSTDKNSLQLRNKFRKS